MAFKRENVIRSAEKYVSKGKLEAAIKEYRKVLADNPNDANTLNRVGDLYARIEKFDEAVKLFTQIAEQYTRDGFFVKAIAIYKKIIKLAPTSLPVYERLAELYYKQGLLNEARQQYQVLADYYQKHDNATSAVTIYQKMSQLEPENPTFHLKLAELYARLRLTDKAMASYRQLADIMIVNGSVDEATQVYLKAIEVSSEDLDFIRDAVMGLNEGGHVGAAAQVLAKAVELNPDARELTAELTAAQEEPEPAPEEPEPPAEEPTAVAEEEDPFASPETSFDMEVEGGDAFASTETSFADLEEPSFEEPSFEEPSFAAQPGESTGYVPQMESDFDGDESFTLSLDDDEEPDTLVKPPADLAEEPVEDEEELEFDLSLEDEQDSLAMDDGTAVGAVGQELEEDETNAIQQASEEVGPGSESVEIEWSMDAMADLDLELPAADPVVAEGFGEEPEPSFVDQGFEIEDTGDPLPFSAPEASPDVSLDGESFDLEGEELPLEDEEPLALEEEPLSLNEEPLSLEDEVALPDEVPLSLDDEEDALATYPGEEQPLVMDDDLDLTLDEGRILEEASQAAAGALVEPPEEASPPAPAPEEPSPPAPAPVEAAPPPASAPEVQPPAPPPPAAAEQPPAVHREEDLLAEAQVFVKYGLHEKARDRLGELLRIDPDHLAALALETRMNLEAGRHQEALTGANRVALLAKENGDSTAWDDLKQALVEAGYGVEGDRVREPGEKPAEDDRIAQLLEDLSLDDFSSSTPTRPKSAVDSEPVESLPTEMPVPQVPPAAQPEAPVDPTPVAASPSTESSGLTAPSPGKKLISLVDELGLDELEDELGFGPEEGQPVVASAPAPTTEEPVADVLDETGMSWLDDPGEEEPAAAAPVATIFDDEDDFFDLAAELERELTADELNSDEGIIQPQEQSLEEIIEGFKQGVSDNLSQEDYDTHFNLGIAYREMGLLDEAIGEFQLASKDERYLVECSSLLGICFLDKGLPELAIRWYRKGLEATEISEEATLGLLYDMADAYVSTGDSDAAYKTFVEVYGRNSNYRDVSNRLEELRAAE